jgi:hypothetical protein
MSPIDRARQVVVEPLPGRDGLLLAKTIALGRELQHGSNGEPFVLTVRYVQNYLELPDQAQASAIVRQLERRGFLHCERRGTKTTPKYTRATDSLALLIGGAKVAMSYRPICDSWILARSKMKYFGAYPSGFLERARALLGVTCGDSVLQVCSGRVRDYPYRGFEEHD